MGGFGAAAIVGIGLTAWREVHRDHLPPVPGALLGVAGLFMALALVADASPAARPLVTMIAWGLDIAGVLHGTQVSQAEKSSATAQGSTA